MSKKYRSKTFNWNKSASRITHWALALALLPFLWAALRQTGLLFPRLAAEGFAAWWRYAAGVLTYVLVERFLERPMWLYVFGHELTHAASGLLFGARIHSFKAKATGGEVRLSKSNAVIALSPYIVPLYALVLIGLYALTRHWWDPPQLKPVFEFLLGMAVAFHVTLTWSAIHKHQTDLKVLGFFLSGVLILFCNVLILAALGISLFSKTPTFSAYGKAFWRDSKIAWSTTFEVARAGVRLVEKRLKEEKWIR